MFDGFVLLLAWFANLFNPPPLVTMDRGQKVIRIFLVALTLVLSCTLAAVFAAMALFLAGQARALAQDRTAMAAMEIIFVGVGVNALCLRTVLAIRSAR